MKILMTGMSARSVGSTKIRYDFFNVPDLLKNALQELGHEVDMRVVNPEEDRLDHYDLVMCQVNWASSLSSMHAHEAGLAMAKAPRLLLYVDDWRAETLADDIEYHIHRDKGWTRHTEKFRPREYARLTQAEVISVREAYRAIIGRGVRASEPIPILVPFFGWGDHDLFFGAANNELNVTRLDWDPSPLVEIPEVRPLMKRRPRNWVLASLQNHDPWLKRVAPGWPVVQFGGVKKGGGGIRAGGSDVVVSERKVVEAYAFNQGALSPPYRSAGSGYWRVRYNYALAMGAVMFAGKDGEAIGGPFDLEIREIEDLATYELDDLSERQFHHFEQFTAKRAATMRAIAEAVR